MPTDRLKPDECDCHHMKWHHSHLMGPNPVYGMCLYFHCGCAHYHRTANPRRVKESMEAPF